MKLGRAYLALRYPALAAAQADQALALDPGSADALLLAEAARKPLPRIEPIPAATTAPMVKPAVSEQHVYPIAAMERPRALPPSGAPLPDPRSGDDSVGPPPPSSPPPAPATAASAAQHYRNSLGLIGRREFQGAEAELDQAIAIDPRLAVAYAARASARFGLGRTRDAAVDYRTALQIEPGMATPLYGLAECYRLLGDPGAANLYERYAQSRAPDVREELRLLATKRAQELSGR